MCSRRRGYGPRYCGAAGEADFVIEAVPEKLPVKEAVLREISKYVPGEAVIASNTSTMSITMLAQFAAKPENFIGMHYFNPPVLMKLVEVIKGALSSEETVRFSCEYVEKLGKVMIYSKKDSPGFIANRIAAPIPGREMEGPILMKAAAPAGMTLIYRFLFRQMNRVNFMNPGSARWRIATRR